MLRGCGCSASTAAACGHKLLELVDSGVQPRADMWSRPRVTTPTMPHDCWWVLLGSCMFCSMALSAHKGVIMPAAAWSTCFGEAPYL